MTQADRRNPYVILGVPFGASEKDARGGFSRARRRLRQNPDQPFTAEDLTWALHQVEQILLKPELAFEVYRIPAVAATNPVGVFNPGPHRLPRTTDQATAEDWEQVKRSAISVAVIDALATTLADQSSVIPYETE